MGMYVSTFSMPVAVCERAHPQLHFGEFGVVLVVVMVLVFLVHGGPIPFPESH